MFVVECVFLEAAQAIVASGRLSRVRGVLRTRVLLRLV